MAMPMAADMVGPSVVEKTRRISPLHWNGSTTYVTAKPNKSNLSTLPVSPRSRFTSTIAKLDPNRYNGWNFDNIRNDHTYGTESNPKIWVMREFVNSQPNHLGMPLSKASWRRFIVSNDDGQVEFTGENMIDHTPEG